MKSTSLFLLLIFFSGGAFAQSNNGVDIDDMVYLYKEPIEMYWNDWKGKRLQRNDIYISGQGKTSDFHGIVHLNCDSGSGYSWVTASNFNNNCLTEADFNDIVPIQALSVAFQKFCPKEY